MRVVHGLVVEFQQGRKLGTVRPRDEARRGRVAVFAGDDAVFVEWWDQGWNIEVLADCNHGMKGARRWMEFLPGVQIVKQAGDGRK